MTIALYRQLTIAAAPLNSVSAQAPDRAEKFLLRHKSDIKIEVRAQKHWPMQPVRPFDIIDVIFELRYFQCSIGLI